MQIGHVGYEYELDWSLRVKHLEQIEVIHTSCCDYERFDDVGIRLFLFLPNLFVPLHPQSSILHESEPQI